MKEGGVERSEAIEHLERLELQESKTCKRVI